jgi:2-iminobutanoate/2-iminopropanoate deaminase
MPVELKNPPGVAPPVAFFSHVAVVPAASRMLVLSGQVGSGLDGAFAETLEGQFQQALDNILAIVGAEGGDARSIARLTCYFTERPKDAPAIAAAMARVFPAGYPAMTWIYVAGLFASHVKVEIEALAAVD